jgi:hypothetical protein
MSALSVIRLNAQDVTFQVSAPPAVAAGMQFQIAYSINVARAAEFRLPPEFSEVFDIRFGPTQSTASSMQIANGRQTRTESTTFTTVVIAKNEGTHTLGPATVRVGNSEYKSNSLTINVLPPDQTAQVQQQGGGGAQQQGGRTADASSGISAESLFMRMIVSNRDVYEQEGFLVTFKLYYLVDIGTIAPRFPDFDGFFAQDIDLNDDQRGTIENYNGRNYRTYILRQTILYPQRSGSITIGSGKVETEVRVRNQSRGSSFFDDFFSSYRTVKHEVESQPATINVKPLPSGKPASFTGAVGNYTMTSEINRTELKANEAVTIKLTIRGNGNIRLLRNPEVRFPNDFEIFDPVQNNNIRVTTTGVSGSRTIEYTAIPRFAGEFEIPGVNFSFFNPQTGRYETQTTEAYRLTVERDESSSDAPPVISTFTNRESVRFLGQDIRYLKTQRIHFIPQHKEIFFGSFLYVMAYLIIAILSVVFFIIYRKQVKENSNLALVRTKKANKTAVKRLKQAEKLLKENKEEAFYEEVLRTLWGYLSDKLNIPQSELAKDNVAMELTKYGVDEVLTGEFLEIIHTCEFARYAPSKTSAAMDNTFRVTIDAISKMENTLKK